VKKILPFVLVMALMFGLVGTGAATASTHTILSVEPSGNNYFKDGIRIKCNMSIPTTDVGGAIAFTLAGCYDDLRPGNPFISLNLRNGRLDYGGGIKDFVAIIGNGGHGYLTVYGVTTLGPVTRVTIQVAGLLTDASLASGTMTFE